MLRIGRLKAISVFGALLFISDIANVFSINVYMYLCMRFCMGFTLIAASSAFNTYCETKQGVSFDPDKAPKLEFSSIC